MLRGPRGLDVCDVGFMVQVGPLEFGLAVVGFTNLVGCAFTLLAAGRLCVPLAAEIALATKNVKKSSKWEGRDK